MDRNERERVRSPPALGEDEIVTSAFECSSWRRARDRERNHTSWGCLQLNADERVRPTICPWQHTHRQTYRATGTMCRCALARSAVFNVVLSFSKIICSANVECAWLLLLLFTCSESDRQNGTCNQAHVAKVLGWNGAVPSRDDGTKAAVETV